MTPIPEPGSYFCNSYGDYKNLSVFEDELIGLYFLDYDPAPIAEIIRSNADMSSGMREFIADVIAKKIKRPNGKKAKSTRRDKAIYQEVDIRLRSGAPLRDSRKSRGAADTVAEKRGMESDAVIKAWQRTTKKIKDDGSMAFFNSDGDIISVTSHDPD